MTRCHVCRTLFDPVSAAGGQCPRCLLMGGAADLDDEPGAQGGPWQAPSVADLQPLLPGYELLEFIGRGGMGAVYKARQPALDRLVAIKVLPAGAAGRDESFEERFRNEARLLARMSHPGIVHVYDFGVLAEGSCCFVMEYVDGTDVARMVAGSGKLSPEHAASITADVCTALHYAHEAGIVHRDIKPANILVNRQGQVKVADFGLAKDPRQESLTQTRQALGTPEFLAPESLTPGKVADHRADLYAVGVMLYNMLTGQIPRGVFPPASQTAPVPRAFDDIISRAMQADPEHRYQSAAAIKQDVDKANGAAAAPPGRWRWRPGLSFAAASCLVAAAGVWHFRGDPAAAASSGAVQPLPQAAPPPEPVPVLPKEEQDREPAAVDFDALFRELRESNPETGLLDRASRDRDGARRLVISGDVLFLRLNGLAGLRDISCLRSMGITHLDIRDTAVQDFRPALSGPLRSLYFTNGPGIDTRVLEAQQLEEVTVEGEHPFDLNHIVSDRLHYLDLKNTPVDSLELLARCRNLRNLFLSRCPVQDLSPLRGLPLQTISLEFTKVVTLEPLRGMKPLHEVKVYECPVRDFSPLREVPGLQTLAVDGIEYEGARLRGFLGN